jgi:hypothetical protein
MRSWAPFLSDSPCPNAVRMGDFDEQLSILRAGYVRATGAEPALVRRQTKAAVQLSALTDRRGWRP